MKNSLREVIGNLRHDMYSIIYIDNNTRERVKARDLAKDLDKYFVTEIRYNDLLMQTEIFISKEEN